MVTIDAQSWMPSVEDQDEGWLEVYGAEGRSRAARNAATDVERPR